MVYGENYYKTEEEEQSYRKREGGAFIERTIRLLQMSVVPPSRFSSPLRKNIFSRSADHAAHFCKTSFKNWIILNVYWNTHTN